MNLNHIRLTQMQCSHMSVNISSSTLALGAAPPQLLHVSLATERCLLPHVAPQAQVCSFGHLLILRAQRAPGLQHVPAQLLMELLEVDLRAEVSILIGRVVVIRVLSVTVALACCCGDGVVTVGLAQRLPHSRQESRDFWKM